MQRRNWLVSPLRRPTFVGAKVGKTPCPCIRPYAALRVPSLRHCSRRDRTEGPSWPYGARRPSMACTRLRNTYTQPTEGTIQGVWAGDVRKTRSTSKAPHQRLAVAVAVAVAVLLPTQIVQTPQIVPSVGRMEPLRSGATAMDGRRAPQGQDGPSARSPREQGWNEGTRSAAQGRMQGHTVLPTFAPTKAGRRKGETSQWCHHIKRICSQQFGPPSTKRRRYVPPTCPAISNHQLRKNASKSALMVSAWVVGMPWG